MRRAAVALDAKGPAGSSLLFLREEQIRLAQDLMFFAYRDFTGAVLEEAGKLATDVLHPLNAVGDREGCRLENGIVRTPTGFPAAFDQVRDGGWTAL